jgi:Acetyltransferase (GNAT) domain
MTMACSFEIYDSIKDVPLDDWRSVSRDGGASVFMDPGFLAAAERGLADQSRFRHVVFYQDRRAVACATLSTFLLDLTLLAGSRTRTAMTWGRRVLPSLGTTGVLFCGTPVSLGQHQLALTPQADPARILSGLDSLMGEIARREGLSFLIFKEFGMRHLGHMDLLLRSGYHRAESIVNHMFPQGFRDLEEYCESLTSHYRKVIRRSRKKARVAGLRHVLLRGSEIVPVYTPEVHRLYEAVVARAETVLEILPINYFQELIRHLGDRVSLTAIYRGDRVVAINWCMLDDRTCHLSECGLDYEMNAECDLYFNLIYEGLDDALRSGADRINLGQTADAFKARLGCDQERLFFYIRGTGRFSSWVLRQGAGLLFPDPPEVRKHEVFKSAASRPSPARRAAPAAMIPRVREELFNESR